MCFRSDEEHMEIPRSVVDSSGRHITPKLLSDFGPWNCGKLETFF